MNLNNDAASLIADIYDAAVTPGAFGRLPEIMARAADGGSAVVGVFHNSGHTDAVTWGLPEDALLRYSSYYHLINPWHRTASALGITMSATRSTDIVPDLQFRQTEFYTDFARGIDTVQVLGTPLVPLGGGWIGEVGVHRGGRNKNFHSRNVNRLQSLLPHLQRALQLRTRLGRFDYDKLGFASLESLMIGCVICDRGGRVIFANAAAESAEMAGDGIALGDHRRGIGALRADESKKLLEMVVATAGGSSGGAMALTGRDGARLFVLVSPLPSRFGDKPSHVLITFRNDASGPGVGDDILRQLFRLTPAEARLTLALLAGRSLLEIGAEHRVSEHTLRSQLASVLRKTETSNQRELVRVLGRLPPLRSPSG